MSTVLTHAIVGAAAVAVCGRLVLGHPVPARLWIVAAACSMAPDLDVILHGLGVDYRHPWGHRGMTHGLLFAAVLAAVVSSAAFRGSVPLLGAAWWRLTGLLFVITASHGLLDACTDGGLGIAFLAPFSERRTFMPWRPLSVPLIGLSGVLSAQTGRAIASEILWVWSPLVVVSVTTLLVRCRARSGREGA